MTEFNIRTDAVDVEQIMRQIRARIQEKRGVDYTEQQIQELANVKLERFLDPKGVRSDLVAQFREARTRQHEPFELEQYSVDANDLFGSSRGPVRLLRRLFRPVLKMLLNANRLVQVLHHQSEINRLYEKQFHQIRDRRDAMDALYYELVHNLVLELTRIGIENRNVKMRLESLSSRLDFDERRARALEGVVQYRAGTAPAREAERSAPDRQPAPSRTEELPAAAQAGVDRSDAADTGTARRRRRRRRGRRGGKRSDESPVAISEQDLAPADPLVTTPHGDPVGHAAMEHEDHDDPEDDDSSDPEPGGEGQDPSRQ